MCPECDDDIFSSSFHTTRLDFIISIQRKGDTGKAVALPCSCSLHHLYLENRVVLVANGLKPCQVQGLLRRGGRSTTEWLTLKLWALRVGIRLDPWFSTVTLYNSGCMVELKPKRVPWISLYNDYFHFFVFHSSTVLNLQISSVQHATSKPQRHRYDIFGDPAILISILKWF